jgi:hypothetical protein
LLQVFRVYSCFCNIFLIKKIYLFIIFFCSGSAIKSKCCEVEETSSGEAVAFPSLFAIQSVPYYVLFHISFNFSFLKTTCVFLSLFITALEFSFAFVYYFLNVNKVADYRNEGYCPCLGLEIYLLLVLTFMTVMSLLTLFLQIPSENSVLPLVCEMDKKGCILQNTGKLDERCILTEEPELECKINDEKICVIESGECTSYEKYRKNERCDYKNDSATSFISKCSYIEHKNYGGMIEHPSLYKYY